MIALDATFLIDYLDEEPAAAAFLEERRDRPFFAPSLALFETYRGAARVGGRAAVDRVTTALDWIEPIALTDAAGREAAAIEAELIGEGSQINLWDVLIAGMCRHNGARLVTRDGDFDRVDGLETVRY